MSNVLSTNPWNIDTPGIITDKPLLISKFVSLGAAEFTDRYGHVVWKAAGATEGNNGVGWVEGLTCVSTDDLTLVYIQ